MDNLALQDWVVFVLQYSKMQCISKFHMSDASSIDELE